MINIDFDAKLRFALFLLLRAAIFIKNKWKSIFKNSKKESRIARLPSINLYRLLVSGVSFVVISIFWLFYAFKVIHWNQWQFTPIIQFTSCYVDVLLFLHYLGLVILYLRCKHTVYLLEVIRSTDGEVRYYNAGANSIQATAAYVLQKYYRDFPLYNPALQYRSKSSYRVRSSSFQVYNIDEQGENNQRGK
jgi:vang-like